MNFIGESDGKFKWRVLLAGADFSTENQQNTKNYWNEEIHFPFHSDSFSIKDYIPTLYKNQINLGTGSHFLISLQDIHFLILIGKFLMKEASESHVLELWPQIILDTELLFLYGEQNGEHTDFSQGLGRTYSPAG